MRFDCVGLLALLCCTAALAQEWREIRTPPTRRDISKLYQFVAPLDPLDDPARWVGAGHDQSAQAVVTAGEGREPGQKALRVQYEYVGADRLEYVDIGGKAPLDPETRALGLWIKGGKEALPCRVRITDASGECHQFDLGVAVPGQWTLAIGALEGGGFWGGDGNGKLDPPYTLASILFDKLSHGFMATGELAIAELGAYRAVPERLQPHGFRVSVPASQRLLVYEPGRPVRLQVAGEAEVAVPAKVSARLVDPFGTAVSRITADLAADKPAILTLRPPGPGAYDLQLRLAGREADADAPWADFRFAVLPPLKPGGTDSAFGVSTHFGQGWPTYILDAVARAGIKFYRDEISWNAVEAEKGKLVIPDYCLTYIAEGAKRGLEPLIIADYANQHYDDYAFPVSPEARAGFARYSRKLMTDLQPPLRFIEIWNEWCGGCGMNGKQGKAEEYGPTFLEAAQAIRAVDPQAVVTGIGGEWGSEPLPAMMAHGAGAAMDAFSIHPYHYPQLPGQWLRDHLRKAAETARAASGKRVPLWITEIGWPTEMDARGSSFLHQARCLVRMMVIALTSGAEKVFWYDFKDDGPQLTYNEHNFGLVHHQDLALAPKPAYVAYAHLVSVLQGRKLTKHEVTKEGLWRTVYSGKQGTVTVLFAAGEGQKIAVKLDPGAKVEDMFGRPVKATGSVAVGWDPVFVVSG